jgi:hypothetical protein
MPIKKDGQFLESIEVDGNRIGQVKVNGQTVFTSFPEGPNEFRQVGAFQADVNELGAVDGFSDVGEISASSNYDDIFTNQFTTSDFPNFQGDGKRVYMRFKAKWGQIPIWGSAGEYVVKPAPDINKYQTYILYSDGQNGRDEYFRIYYSINNTDFPTARIADVEVVKDTRRTY